MSRPGRQEEPRETSGRADISSYFLRRTAAQLGAETSQMAPTRQPAAGPATLKKTPKVLSGATSPHPRSSPSHCDIRERLQADSQESSITPEGNRSPSGDWKELLALIPTKEDMKDIAATIVSNLAQEINAIKIQVDQAYIKVGTVTEVQAKTDSRVLELENAQALLQKQIMVLQLQQDDSENRSRRNNIRVRGLTEEIPGPELRITVTRIFNKLLNRDSTTDIEMDRVHRVQAPRSAGEGYPRDVLVRVHFYSLKEDIMRRAWDNGPLKYEGSLIKLLSDLSRRTLRMRAIMKPLLEVIRTTAATYHWGHPFHLVIVRNGKSFTLRHYDQLMELFSFLEVPPVQVPDWLSESGKLESMRQYSPRIRRRRRARTGSEVTQELEAVEIPEENTPRHELLDPNRRSTGELAIP